ncbi:hypothetical protein ACQKP4_11675, partial [Pseudomonas sp. NPDC086278]
MLAKAVCQSTLLLDDTPLSRASPLPQGECSASLAGIKKRRSSRDGGVFYVADGYLAGLQARETQGST